jgi:anti-sigma regulatory factor (Ser/Thr protein kinase)
MNAREQASASDGARALDLHLPATPKVAALVRRALSYLELPDEQLAVAQLLASELVTNSIRHAGLAPADEVRVRATRLGERIRVDVYDGSRAELHPLAGSIRPVPGAQSGWGLYLVDRLSDRWGTSPGRYWFEIEDGDDGSA